MNGVNTLVMPKNRKELSARDRATIHLLQTKMELERLSSVKAITSLIEWVEDDSGSLSKQEKYKLKKYYLGIADYMDKQVQNRNAENYIDMVRNFSNYTLFPNM